MKKLISYLGRLCIYACIYISSACGIFSHAQITPVHPEHIMPAMAGPTGPVYSPYYTSAYSYFHVAFDMDGTGLLAQQDLYVYVWTGNNFLRPGLAWIRRMPFTDSIIDQGYFSLPDLRKNHEVGILQDDEYNVYVVMSYNDVPDNSAAKVDVFSWIHTGVVSTPITTENIRFNLSLGYDYWGDCGRISMDCVGLKKAVFSWNEERKWYISVPGSPPILSIGNLGGIYLRAAEISGTSLVMGETHRIDITDSFCVAPDVAIGAGGDSVYVSYIRILPTVPEGYVEVLSDHFSNVMAATSTIASFNTVYSSSPVATSLISPPLYDHIRIDAPDNHSQPFWGMVYLVDHTEMNTVVTDLTTFVPNELFGLHNTVLYDFCTPAIAYSPALDYISLSWFDAGDRRYYGTRINASGTNYVSPASATDYYVISMTPNDAGCFNGGKLSYSTSQQSTMWSTAIGRLFIAYPITDMSISSSDIRTKIVRWNPSSTPFSHSKLIDNNNMRSRIVPNPVDAGSVILLQQYNDELLSIQLTDVLGRTLWSVQNTKLYDINAAIGRVIEALPSGSYLIGVSINGKTEIIRFSKN